MSDIYLSNQPSGTSGGLVWGVGSDSNDGLSPASPKLTANAALDLYSSSSNDGSTLFINDGEYTYTNATGRWIVTHASCTIVAMNDYLTSITFSGSNDQGFRYNFSSSEVRSCFIGKINIKGSPEKLYGFYAAGSSTTLLQSDVECQARFVPNTDGTASSSTRYGYYDLTGSGRVKISGGGVSAADGSLVDVSAEAYNYVPYYQANGLLYNPSVPAHVEVTSWAMNLKYKAIGEVGIFSLLHNAAYPTGSTFNVSGVTGLAEVANTNTANTYFIKATNPPEGTIIEDNNITMTATSTAGVSGIGVVGADVDSLNHIIRNNTLNLTTGSGVGQGIVIGAEGATGAYANTSGDMYGNTVNYTNTGVTNNVHGINHINAEGSRYNNTVSGVSIGSLTKASGASSYSNTISIDPTSASQTHLYAKGSYAGASFTDEVLISTSNFTGTFAQSLVNDSTGGADVYSDNASFSDIIINGDMNAGAKLLSVGYSAGDNSTAVVSNITLPEDAPTLNIYGRSSLTDYTNLTDLNNLSWVSGVVIDTGDTTPIITGSRAFDLSQWREVNYYTAAEVDAAIQDAIDGL